ncbi:hypothetical protein C8J56DRAFT_197847, partial [Mycena floridula]
MPPILTLPDELLRFILYLLVDDTDYEDVRKFPECLYNWHPTEDISALSVVSHDFRRIILPLLFHYVKCSSLGELQEFRYEICSPSLAGCIRTLDLHFHKSAVRISRETCGILIHLLPILVNVVRIDVHQAEIDTSLLLAINDHRTLETVSISAKNRRSLPSVPSSGSLHKILLYGPSRYSISHKQRGMRVADLSFAQHPFGTTPSTPVTLSNSLVLLGAIPS